MTKLRDAARDMPCMVRIPGVCIDGDHSTTVLAHVRMATLSGVGLKPHDLLGSWCCAACHNLVDGRAPRKGISRIDLRNMHLEGVIRTIDALIRTGKVKI